MGKVKNRQFWESATMNNATFMQYYRRLVEISISQFEWLGFPETVDTRYLELALFAEGKAVFFKDDVMGYLGLQCLVQGDLSVYRIPKKRRAISVNGYQKDLNEKNSVLIYNNFLRTNSMLDVEMYAKRLYNIDRTIDVNVNAQKTPVLITCSEDERMTMKNAYMKYEGNEPVIYGDKNLNPANLKVFNTGAPYVANNLYELRTKIWNEAMTFQGIANVGDEKKERMITEEVQTSQGAVLAYRYSRLEPRKQAARQINAMFPELGGKVDCRYRESVAEYAEKMKEEVIENE